MVKIVSKGSFKNSYRFMQFLLRKEYLRRINAYGERGVEALRAATPVDSGKTANSWYYTVDTSFNSVRITWRNSNIAGRVPVAILLQYGHATPSGTFVQGNDFVNPALKETFKQIADDLWKEVERA